MPSTVIFTIGSYVLTTGALASFIAKLLVSVVISKLLAKKPSQSDLSGSARDQQVTTRDPVAAGRVIYGETRVGGVMVFAHTTGISQGEVVVRDENHTVAASITVSANGGPFAANVAVQLVDYVPGVGYEYQTMGHWTGGGDPPTGQYAVNNGVYTFNPAQFGRSVRISYSVLANQLASGKYLHLVIELACHEVEAINDLYFDDELIPIDGFGYATGRHGSHVYFAKYLGTADQAANTTLIAAAGDKWTTSHRLRGRAYIYVRLTKNVDLFPNGVPNIRVDIKGRKVYDPRTGLTAWSNNNALCTNDFLCNTDFGLGHVYAGEINEDPLIAAANVCDEAVPLATGGTEARYTCNGTVVTSEQPKDILARFRVSMAGNIVRIGGKWNIYAGAYSIPTVTLTEDDLRGPIQVRPRLSRRELFNAVKGVYAGPANGYQPADFPAVTNAAYLAEDQGERIWLDVDFPFTATASRSQRLAKIELERVRQQITVVMPCKLSAWRVQPPQTVMVTNEKFGWTNKVFEVTEMKLAADAGEDGSPYLGVDLVLRETASTVFDWSAGEETVVDPAPDTNLPNPFAVAPPGSPVVTEEKYSTTGSAGVKSRALVSWSDSPDAQAVQYGLEYRVSGDEIWIVRPLVRATADALDDLAPAIYDFRVVAFNNVNSRSVYSGTTTQELIGLSDPPEDVTGFSVIKSGGLGIVQWAPHPALDVQINGAIVIRHTSLTSSAAWVDGVLLGEFPGKQVAGQVPLITGTYMAKARDSSGNYSEMMVAFVASEGMVNGFVTVGTITQHPTFAGAKSNVAFDGDLDGIKLDGTTFIDDMVTDIDDWPFLDGLGGVSATGSYAFDDVLDLGTVGTRRFEVAMRALSYDTGDLVDDRTDPVDTWGPIDGAEIDDCNVRPYARMTDDDPTGSPVWGPWAPFHVADFTGRAAQFKLDFISGNATHNIIVSELAVVAREPV